MGVRIFIIDDCAIKERCTDYYRFKEEKTADENTSRHKTSSDACTEMLAEGFFRKGQEAS